MNYKKFYGKNIEQMPKLISEGLKPMTIKEIIRRRLNCEEYFKSNWFDTCDMVVCFKDKFKIEKDCDLLRSINPNTELKNRGIKITEEQYKKLKGKEFQKGVSKEDVWKYLLENLYDDYMKLLGYCPEYYLTDYDLSGRSFYVDGLEGDWSYVDGGDDVDGGVGRLVGYATELQVKKVKILKSIPTKIEYKGYIYVLENGQ